MGVTAPKKRKEEKDKEHNNPKYLKYILELSQKICRQYLNEREDIILKKREEIIKFLSNKDINSSKQTMEKILKAEDDKIVFDLLNRIIETLIEKANLLLDNKECPPTLKVSLNTILFSASRLEIKELKEFREIIKEKYGQEFLSKADNNEELLVNEVLVEKLKKNIYSEQLIKTRLRNICIEKKIDYQFLDTNNENNHEQNNSQSKNSSSRISFDDQSALHPGESQYNPRVIIRRTKNIHNSSNFKSNLGKSSIKRSTLNPEEANDKNINDNNDDKYAKKFDEVVANDPFKRLETIEDPNKLFIIKKGEEMFLPYDEKNDEKCYKFNKMENWADSFYNLKSGIILEKYKELISKTEFSSFFEALNYEYGINNYPLDTKKAFEKYKNAADNTSDTLSMYRLYHIYKKDFKKFNINERSHVLEIFYIMKCFSSLTELEKENELFGRFDIYSEIKTLLMDENRIFYDWYLKYFEFLKFNYSYYNIKKDDVILIESVIYYWFETKEECVTEVMNYQIDQLAKQGNPLAMYNLAIFYNEKDNYSVYLEKLYNMNSYRYFNDYAKNLTDKKEALTILKKSIDFGYLNHINDYYEIFLEMYEIENIVKSATLKSQLIFILNCFIDNIIIDQFTFLYDYIYIRNILIKHYNFEDEFKKYSDNYLKEIINYLLQFFKGNNDENKNKIISNFGCFYFYQILFTVYGFMNFYGVKGINEKNYNETLNIYNYLLKNNESFLFDRFYLYIIYTIKNKQRRLNNHSNEKEDKELMLLEKKVLDLFYEELSVEKIKKLPPNCFYKLSKLFRNNAFNTKDLILEYVFLNRASNSTIIKSFEDNYVKSKASKKIKEKNKEENFKKIKEAKGAINAEGYGENGMICPICMQNKKSIIALPCKHFFCGTCMDKLLNDGTCPICRTQIKITFDFNLKKETLIKSFLPPKDEPFENDPFLVPELDIFD